MTGFWRAEAAALLPCVTVRPKSRRPGLEGVPPGPDRLRLALTKALGLPASAVEVAQGAAARDKTLRISGDPTLLIPKIEAPA
ncbi:MAG: hypothetical protein LW713_02160 [Acetobacteraceae bacterium]|jgi:uncharacterized protein YggU (UPF0235/DUF167 family)|nr:hypothetical protein [Acetobacteraceae bacterium]